MAGDALARFGSIKKELGANADIAQNGSVRNRISGRGYSRTPRKRGRTAQKRPA